MPESKTYRAAVIGATGRGNYGHGHDVVFKGLEGFEYVAIADADEQGLMATGKKAGVKDLYRDYKEMLAKTKPDVVAIGPRHTDQRVEMVRAAAAAGCQIYIEKPIASNLVDADAVIAACDQAKVKISAAHQMNGHPPVRKALEDIRAGKYGKLIRMRARGKEDQRGGGEDLIVLGTHLMDLMILFGGPPKWVQASVGVDDRPAELKDARKPTEPVGLVAGNRIAATYGFDNGVIGTFHSASNVARSGKSPYGLCLELEEAIVCIRSGDVFVYSSPVVVPENPKLTWEKIWVEDWHFLPNHKPRDMGDKLERGNHIIVADLMRAAAENREPMASGQAARYAIEMIQGVYASHFAGGARLPIPLAERRHPLEQS